MGDYFFFLMLGMPGCVAVTCVYVVSTAVVFLFFYFAVGCWLSETWILSILRVRRLEASFLCFVV